MTRFVITLLVVFALALGAVWLAERPGNVTLVWGGWRIDTSLAVLVALTAAFGLVVAALLRSWHAVRTLPKRVGASFRDHRRHRGYRALTRGMVAVAAGDSAEAGRQAKRARGLLDEPPLTMLLSAQAAQLGGDERAAETFFRDMLTRPDMEFLGLRGLLTQSLRRKNWDEALQLAERARLLRPKSEWVAATLFDLQARTAHWAEAELTARDALSARLIAGPAGRHQRAIALALQAIAAEQAANGAEALRLAQKALELDAALAPAALLAARQFVAAGKERRARRVLRHAWQAEPQPSLVAAYQQASPGAASDAMAAVKAVRALAQLRPEHPESLAALARAYVDARLWGEARAQAERLIALSPTARAFRLMAEISAGDADDPTAAGPWLEKASRAPADPAWICDNCGFAAENWLERCPSCDAFAPFHWQAPRAGGVSGLGSAVAPPQAALAVTRHQAEAETAPNPATPPARPPATALPGADMAPKSANDTRAMTTRD